MFPQSHCAESVTEPAALGPTRCPVVARLRVLSCSRKKYPANATIIFKINDDFEQSCGALFAVCAFAHALSSSNRYHGQGGKLTFITNGLFQRIDSFHVPIIGEEQHLAGLCKAPHRTISTGIWKADICEAHQAHGKQL